MANRKKLADRDEEVMASQSFILPDSQALNFQHYLLEVTAQSGRVMQKMVSSLEQAKYEATILSRVKNDKFVKFNLRPVVIADEDVHHEVKRLLNELSHVRVDQNIASHDREQKTATPPTANKNNKGKKCTEKSSQIGKNSWTQQFPNKSENDLQIVTELMPTIDAKIKAKTSKTIPRFIKLEKSDSNSFQPKIEDGKYIPLVNLGNNFHGNPVKQNTMSEKSGSDCKRVPTPSSMPEKTNDNKFLLVFPEIAEAMANSANSGPDEVTKNPQAPPPEESPIGVKTRQKVDLSQYKFNEIPKYKPRKNSQTSKIAKTASSAPCSQKKTDMGVPSKTRRTPHNSGGVGTGTTMSGNNKVDSSKSKKSVTFNPSVDCITLSPEKSDMITTKCTPQTTHSNNHKQLKQVTDDKLLATPIVIVPKVNNSHGSQAEINPDSLSQSSLPVQPEQKIQQPARSLEPEIIIQEQQSISSDSDSELDEFHDSSPHPFSRINNNSNKKSSVTSSGSRRPPAEANYVDEAPPSVEDNDEFNENPVTAPDTDMPEDEVIPSEVDDTDDDPDFMPDPRKEGHCGYSSDSEIEFQLVDEYPKRKKKRNNRSSRVPTEGNSNAIDESESIAEDGDYIVCPTHDMRIGDTLKITFPITGPLSCTERDSGCVFRTFQKEWPRKIGNLKRHVVQKHKIPIKFIERWCSLCQEPLRNPRKIARHHCWRDNPDINHSMFDQETYDKLPFKCEVCNTFATDNPSSLRSHNKIHMRDARARNEVNSRNMRAQVPVASSAPQTNDTESVARDAIDAQELPENRTNTSSQNISQKSTQSEDDEGAPSGTQVPSASQDGEDGDEYFDAEEDQEELEEMSDDELQGMALNNLSPNVNDDPASEEFVDRLKQLMASYSDDKWEEFESLVEEVTTAAQAHVKIKNVETTFQIRNGDARDPTSTQRTYRRNRRRAMRLVKGEQNSYCRVQVEDLKKKFFSDVFPEPDLSIYNNCKKAERPPSAAMFSTFEVKKKLKASENSAPGPDRLTYNHWKSFDPHAKALAIIYNICLKAKKIPSAWKQSTTIFIPKSGDPLKPENWRPISLSSTIYKLFACLISKRISNWMEKNKLLAKNQKGFRPFDGAVENNFVLETRIQDAKRLKKELFIILLDLKDAFGSITHPAIFAALEAAGLGETYMTLFQDMYSGMITRLMTVEGLSEEIPVVKGVKQGCPLSGLVFNITIDPIYEVIQMARTCLFALGYADDTAVLEKTVEDLQNTIDRVKAFLDRLGLKLNPAKCKTLHIDPKRASCGDARFKIGEEEVPALESLDAVKYLGKPVGYRLFDNNLKIDEYIAEGMKILNSTLAPWQKIDALKCFFFPSLSYAMRTSQFGKDAWRRIDTALKPKIKEILGLPTRASNSYLYGSTEDGLLGIPLASFDSDVAKIDTAFKLIMSDDDEVRKLAWDALAIATRDRVKHNPSTQEIQEYLSNGPMEDTSNRYTSIWAKARAASRRLGVVWHLSDDGKATLIKGDKAITDRQKVFSALRESYRKWHSHRLKSFKSQGKTLECYAQSKASSHFIRTGDFLRFTDWKFIHAARLGVVDLNGTIPGKDKHEKVCRWCPWPNETLPHVIDHCTHALSKTITNRHDRVVQRIIKAASGKWKVLKENKPYGKNRRLRPDIILVKGNDEAIIIDVTIPFDNGLVSFAEARQEKLNKYKVVADDLKAKYKKVSCDAIVVGALGSWDKKNDKTVAKLCSKKYATMMRKLIVSDCIRASRDIYIEHVTDIEQIDLRSRMRFQKRGIYPSEIIDEWYENDEQFPTRAKIPAHGFTAEGPVTQAQQAPPTGTSNIPALAATRTIPANISVANNNTVSIDLGDEIFNDPAPDSQVSTNNDNHFAISTNALSVSSANNVDSIGPPHPLMNTAAISTSSREVCNNSPSSSSVAQQQDNITFEINMCDSNSQDPLSVGAHLCRDVAAQHNCLSAGAHSCDDGASQPPPSSPGSGPTSVAVLGPVSSSSALATPPSAETHKVEASGGGAKSEVFSDFCNEGCSSSGE